MSHLYLIGGGPGGMAQLRTAIKRALPKLPGGRRPAVAYVGAASGDNVGFQTMIATVIAAAGGRTVAVKLASARANVSTARRVLDDCDALFISGGDVEAGMKVLCDRGVDTLITQIGESGRPMIGISAGAIMLARAWVHFPEDETKGAPTLFPCLGLAPLYVDTHAEADAWGELHTLLQLVANAGEEAPLGYGLTTKGGIEVTRGPDTVTLTAFGTDAPRFVARQNGVVATEPLLLGQSETVVVPPPAYSLTPM